MNKEDFKAFLPWWAWIIVAIEAGVPTIFGLATWMDPATYIEGAEGVSYEILLYITRNLTTALGIVLAVMLRSHAAIFILIIVNTFQLFDDAKAADQDNWTPDCAMPWSPELEDRSAETTRPI